ncbi:hypothetical protein M6D93_15850 [Jatrophihabitans telluris]|uniref:Secreted protein n=1 Tax=Jatrophihabitans telluris TaxID=2038343 RepID=A0ABY4QVS9_9ACTN|nr:hypothetical protein [Jatrophihabitans telluris]UQX87761.1 hypothetical protein M6D93_15850 [Jatrophihabitans telluris]
MITVVVLAMWAVSAVSAVSAVRAAVLSLENAASTAKLTRVRSRPDDRVRAMSSRTGTVLPPPVS